uniref:Beta-glucosidase n=1 Tax=Oryza punctata TaxID=4537 RepID=A0A0E0JV54_ORYPU
MGLLRRGSSGAAAAVLVVLCVGCIAAAAAGGGGECPKYKDSKQPLNKRIDDLLGRMTLAEKIGQMSQIERENATFDVMRNYFIGSVLSGGGSVPAAQASPAAWVSMVNEMQRGAMATRLGIPMIYGIDAVHGHGNVYKATIFPHNVGLGCTRDPDLAKRIGAAVAAEVRATGIPYVFAPCVAVCRDPRWGRCYESFSEDPKVVQRMSSIISGFQGDIPPGGRRGVPFVVSASGGRQSRPSVAACSKHYVGDGGTTRGVNENNTVATLRELMTVHMPPYYSAVVQGVSTVMVSFSSWNGVKMHANHFLITDFLKITTPEHADYMLSIKLGIMAGIDMVMIPFTYTEFIDDLTTLVKNGTIPMSRIDDAVRRILRVKFTMGLFENPYADLSLAGELGKQEHRDLAREAVRKSLVLLKNGNPGDAPLLPLTKKPRSILVAGGHADDLGSQCGGWTITWQGLAGNNLTAGTTILDGIRRAVDPATEVVFSENPDAGFMQRNKGRFDYAVVVVGEPPYAETFGDNLNLTIPAPGPSVIQSVCGGGGGGVRCVVVVVSGRPLVIEPYMDAIDALVAAWLPGTEGQGVSDVLFGDYGFTGKLARTWFRSVEQLPMNVGDEHYDPLFPFGFGLETQPYSD